MKPLLMLAISIVSVALIGSCSSGDDLAGTGNSTGNARASGIIVDDKGISAANVEVRLVPAGFGPTSNSGATPYLDTTDGSGAYSFAGIHAGSYTVEALDLSRRTRVLHFGVEVLASSAYSRVGTDTLKRPGGILIPSTLSRTAVVFIPGTTYRVRLDSTLDVKNGRLLDSVGAALIPLVTYVDTTGAALPIASDVRVFSAMVNGFPGWRHSARVVVGSDTTGSELAAEVHAFPLLVRLSSLNFDFGTALPTGDDLRFSKADGSSVPYQIERWDPTLGGAEVWVLVDTVMAESPTVFEMYWGNDTAAGQSSAPAVFGGAAGSIGVWHLGENGVRQRADATGNGFDGTPIGYEGDESVPGVIGNADSLDGLDDLLDLGSVGTGSEFTLSAWIRIALPLDSQIILFKSNDSGVQPPGILSLTLDATGSSLLFGVADASGAVFYCHPAAVPQAQQQWIHVSVSCSGRDVMAYQDGHLVDFNIGVIVSPIAQSGAPLYIGGSGPGSALPYHGVIDEVRMCPVARSASWVKLAYQNQRLSQTLVRIVP